MAEFGEAVIRARSLKGWQLKDLAREMDGNSSISFLSDIEKGKRSISPPTVGKLIKALDLNESWIDRFLSSDATETTEVTQADRVADAAWEQSEKSGDAQRLRDAGITEKTLITLAQKIAAETQDVGQAWLELQNAMEMAVRVQADGRVTSNQGGFVDEVLHRVAELSAEGEYGSAGAEIDAALSREVEETQARQGKLLDRGVEVALLDRDTQRAAGLLVRRVDLEVGGRAGFQDLRGLWDFFYVRGRDKGINLDLELAIDLAKLREARAENSEERGAALNDLGVALLTLGERESGTARLEAAVEAYNAALEMWTRETVPLDWAAVQNDLGNALRTLGAQNRDTPRLYEAITAFSAALEEFTSVSAPSERANTQMNLGSTFANLGEQEADTAWLEKAIVAYQAALMKIAKENRPYLWAGLQNNLGNTYLAFWENGGNIERLELAVKAYETALEVWTKEKAPYDWAGTQINLAVVEVGFF